VTTAIGVRCIDCRNEGITTYRPPVMRRGLAVSGSRCATHYRDRRKAVSEAAWANRLRKLYDLSVAEYWAIYEFQGGCCYICRRATGKARRLAVDHDHATGIVRGLLCLTCNKKVVGHLRDDPRAFARGLIYLLFPPALEVIGERIAPVGREEVDAEPWED
jgi:hypothetical protein